MNSQWVATSDSIIKSMAARDLIQKDAYLLFYKRKEFTPSNILNLTTHHI